MACKSQLEAMETGLTNEMTMQKQSELAGKISTAFSELGLQWLLLLLTMQDKLRRIANSLERKRPLYLKYLHVTPLELLIVTRRVDIVAIDVRDLRDSFTKLCQEASQRQQEADERRELFTGYSAVSFFLNFVVIHRRVECKKQQ